MMNRSSDKKLERQSTAGSRQIRPKLLKQLTEDCAEHALALEELEANYEDDHTLHISTDINCRVRLEHVLESTALEVFVVILVIVDVIILLAMLLMDLNVFHLLLVDKETAAGDAVHLLVENCQGNDDLSHYHGTNLVTVSRYLKQDGCLWDPDSSRNFTANSVSHHVVRRAAGPAVEGENETAVLLKKIVHTCHIISITILAVMVVEVLLKVVALGKRYFKGKLEVIDGIIIIISFALDLVFMEGIYPGEGVNNGATVLVILLLWRILRVFNGLLVTAKKRLSFRIQVQKKMRKSLEEKVELLQAKLRTAAVHTSNLIEMAERHKIPEGEVKICKPVMSELEKRDTSSGLTSMMQLSMGLMQGMNHAHKEKQQNDENLTVTFDVKDLESPSDDTTRAKFETDSPSHSVMSETEQAGVNSTSSDSESDSYRVKKSNADPTGHDNGGVDSGFEISTRSKHRPSLTNQKACIDAGL